MADIDKLRAAKDEADAALADAESGLVDKLVAAKSAYRGNKSGANKKKKDDLAVELRSLREVTRAGRGGVGVGGDAVASTAGNEG